MEQCRGGCSNEMVNSPATTATNPYTMEEDHNDDDNDDKEDEEKQKRISKTKRCTCKCKDYKGILEPYYVRALKKCYKDYNLDSRRVCFVDSRDDYLVRCSHCDNIKGNDKKHKKDNFTGELICDFTYSYQCGQDVDKKCLFTWAETSWNCDKENYNKENYNKVNCEDRITPRRSRKQSQPRKITWNLDDEDLIPSKCLKEEEQSNTARTKPSYNVQMKNTSARRVAIRKLFRCRLCSRGAPGIKKSHRRYYTKPSLILHKLWWHRNKKSKIAKIPHQSLVSSITLKATVYTSPGYGYHR